MKVTTTKKPPCSAISTTKHKSEPPGNFIPLKDLKDSQPLNSVHKKSSKAIKSVL